MAHLCESTPVIGASSPSHLLRVEVSAGFLQSDDEERRDEYKRTSTSIWGLCKTGVRAAMALIGGIVALGYKIRGAVKNRGLCNLKYSCGEYDIRGRR